MPDSNSSYAVQQLLSKIASLIGLGGPGARTTDIELPNESGVVDPRLQKPTAPGAMPAMQNAAASFQRLFGGGKN